MADDVYLPNGKPTLRAGHLLGVMFEVLDEPRVPVRAGEVIRRMELRLDVTPHEASLNKSGGRRWEVYVRCYSSWAKQVGRMLKSPAGWSLTDAGRQALHRNLASTSPRRSTASGMPSSHRRFHVPANPTTSCGDAQG